MVDGTDRRAALIAAAVSHDLSDAERLELDAMRVADPAIDADIHELRLVADRLAKSSIEWDEATPNGSLRARISGLRDDDAPADRPDLDITARSSRRRRPSWALAAAAAACVVAGAGGVLGAQAIASAPVAGPPGTLGAIERVDFTGEPTGSDIEGALVAHTWGTETVLEIDGLAEEGTYEVVLIDSAGLERPSGTFLGSLVTITCRMNAAVLRPDVASIEIHDGDGNTVASAELPAAAAS